MSAITGIFYRNKRKVDDKLVETMNSSLSHRGPDGSNIWIGGPLGLGHQMLWTTPESIHEKLPLEEDGLVITADARIDNRAELCEVLGILNNQNVSDSYFILKAYLKWGEECPKHLLGDFAFAIWDKSEEKLFCARDHMGVKPFYYYLSKDGFFFGTEIKALLSLNEVPQNINQLKIGYYLNLIDERNLTFYKYIFRLPASHRITIDFKKFSLSQYWSFSPENELLLNSDEEYSCAFRDIFTEAVNCRLRSAFPVGAELSGGLDSSSVVSIASKILSKKNISLRTFSLIFRDLRECDESLYINAVLNDNDNDIEPYYSFGDLNNPLASIDRILWHNDGPFFAPGWGTFLDLHHKMEESKTRIMLSGLGGDDVVSHGDIALTDLFRKRKFKTLIKEIDCLSKNKKLSKINIILNVISPYVPDILKEVYHKLQENSHEDISQKIIDKEFYEHLNLSKDNDLSGHEHLKKIRKSREYDYETIQLPYFQRELEELDAYNAIFSLEFRYPFYDRRLIEFCLALPAEQKFKNGWGRMILRRAMDNILPPLIQWRTDKTYMGPNLEYTLLKFEKESIKNIIYGNNPVLKDYVDVNYLKFFFQEYISGKGDFLSYLFYRIIIMDSWLKSMGKRRFL